jgi:hypothetical protein
MDRRGLNQEKSKEQVIPFRFLVAHGNSNYGHSGICAVQKSFAFSYTLSQAARFIQTRFVQPDSFPARIRRILSSVLCSTAVREYPSVNQTQKRGWFQTKTEASVASSPFTVSPGRQNHDVTCRSDTPRTRV